MCENIENHMNKAIMLHQRRSVYPASFFCQMSKFKIMDNIKKNAGGQGKVQCLNEEWCSCCAPLGFCLLVEPVVELESKQHEH